MEKLANLKVSKVPYDAQDNRKTSIYVEGLSAYYHRLLSLGHDPLLGLIFGVFDILTGKMTTIDKTGKIVSQVMENYAERKENDIFSAIAKQIIHFRSDITTSMGLPAPLMGLFNLLQFGNIGEEKLVIAGIVQGMYFEGYEFSENHITANVGIDKIEAVLQHFIVMHDEPQFFILELPANKADETEVALGVIEKYHKDVYYIDGCSREEALAILSRVGNILYNDGLCAFGYGCHESGDEIMFGKYNILTIYSQNIEKYNDFFKKHSIEKVKELITAWDTFSGDYPGQSEKYEIDGKTVYDIPEQFKEWGMYFAEQREE